MQSHYHIFSLPPTFLESLTPRNLISQPTPEPTNKPELIEPVEVSIKSNSSTGCNVCLGANFSDVDEQRNHFRSDWHRYNVKMRLKGGQPVSEPQFSQLVDGLEDSISGSESSSDENDAGGSEDDAVATLVNRTKRALKTSSSDEQIQKSAPVTALTWFHSPPATQIGVYRLIFSTTTQENDYLPELKAMQRPEPEGRKWALFMVAGGHFAGAVARVSREEEEDKVNGGAEGKRRKPPRPKPDTEILKHKTFHRYTTRRKQGGSQSVNDNAKGNAKSAGAQLRRYGEQALRDDIRNLLTDWAEELNDCERIWIRANVSNRRIFTDWEESPIEKGDYRLRTFPFPTRRPTQSELGRCLLELTRVKVSHLTEDALREQDLAYLNSLPKPKPALPTPVATPKPEREVVPKLSKEEEAYRDKWNRLLEMVSKARLEPLKVFWEREGAQMGGIDANIPSWTGEKRATLLQVSAQAGHEELTRWMLEDLHANPTIAVPSEKSTEKADGEDGSNSRRTAYDLAPSREVRNVFRRCAGVHPDWWDWLGAAKVPSVLSKEMEEEQEEKKKTKRKGLKDKVREREAKEREKLKSKPVVEVVEPEPAPNSVKESSLGPKKLGGAGSGSAGLDGLTPEMRMKVERERRARAAEARMKALGGR